MQSSQSSQFTLTQNIQPAVPATESQQRRRSFAKWALLTAEYCPWRLAKKSVSLAKRSLLEAECAPWPFAKKIF